MGEITNLITAIKNGKKDKITLLLQKFKPLFNKYVHILYKDERDDVCAELTAALWEAIIKTQYFDDEAKSVTYLKRALHNKFLELYRNSRKINDNEIDGVEQLAELVSVQEKYGDIVFKEDIMTFLKKYNKSKSKLFYSILFDELSDAELAKKFLMSRQYINRMRKELYDVIWDNYLK